jgi:hypothetical protein
VDDVQPIWLDFVRSALMRQSCVGQATDDEAQPPRPTEGTARSKCH